MAKDFGSGVSRTLDAAMRQFSAVVWQKNKPPLDSELSLISQINDNRAQELIRSMMPSGFLLDPTRPGADFECNQQWANLFKFGVPPTPRGAHEEYRQVPVVWANVNGWLIPVAGSNSEGTSAGDWDDIANWVKLNPPPESDTRIDFVFLEAWQTVVHTNPATENKPSADKLWKYGNVQYGGTNVDDDLTDPEIRFETTARVQVQYRLRVHGSGVGLGGSVALDVHPDGLGDPNIFGQGTATSPVSGNIFANMGRELGDPSLWRAGDGDPNNSMGTIDGYVYAIPVCAIFRRNSNVYVAVTQSGNPNQNGAFERTPNSKTLPDPTAGSQELTTPTLTSFLSATAAEDGVDAVVPVTGLNGSGLDDSSLVLSSTFIQIDDEILSISAVDLIGGTITIPAVADVSTTGRGRNGTVASGHQAGAQVKFFNSRPDGLFSDQITESDVLDLRRAVNAQEWDYIRLLEHNMGAITRGTLQSTWKKAGEGNTQGPVVHEVDYLYADGATAVPNHTEALDGPDGIRTVFSDAATVQSDVTLLLDNDATQDTNHYVGFTNDPLDDTVEWDVGPDFKPSAFMNVGAGDLAADNVWTNGSLIFLYTGGADGTQGARGTFRDGSTRAVRALMPKEYWTDDDNLPATGRQTPVTVRFLEERALEPAPTGLPTIPNHYSLRHVGPMYPWVKVNFEYPIIVLGGILRDSLSLQNVPVADFGASPDSFIEIDLTTVDFDVEGAFFHKENGRFVNDPAQISAPLLRGSRTLWGMLTDNGKDPTGRSSEVYLVVHGDPDSRANNGVFKVLGAGTAGYTNYSGTNSTSVVLWPLNSDFVGADWGGASGNAVSIEFRSHVSNSDDTSNYVARAADVVVGMTDLGGTAAEPGITLYGSPSGYPFRRTLMGYTDPIYDLSMPRDANEDIAAIPSKMLINMSLLYHPGRGGMARLPDEVDRFAMKFGTTETLGAYLRQSGTAIDNVFSASSGVPSDETYFDPVHVQLWNRLPSLGLAAPLAPSYGGRVVGFTEQDREHEVLFDRGSKSLIVRPFRDREMTLQGMTFTLLGTESLLADYTLDLALTPPKDALQMWTGTAPNIATTGKQMGFAVPSEFMPRFGRQDIPVWQRIGNSDPFLPGINHLFVDSSDWNKPVFNIIGGESNLGAGLEVNSFFFTTATPTSYCLSDTIVGPVNNRAALHARKTTDIPGTTPAGQAILADLARVNSSDLGKGLKGIQIPPYYGLARLYGVYDARDYTAKGGRTFKANRYEMEEDAAPNLLRGDADQQSLFILQDGGQDVVTDPATGAHTYIVPSNVLDITRALNYAEGDEFEDYEYIVECAVFGFSHDWINGNNYVLIRKFDGTGSENADGDDPQLEGVHMVIPCPAGSNDQFYVAYDRTVYQGDPFMTRSGDVKTDSDYEHRYGQISMANQFAMETVIQQYDSNGDFVPQTPNVRAFEILASMDFYTTLGSGKFGGELYPGTPLDIGFTDPAACHRNPDASDQPAWRVLPRAFTQGQSENETRAVAGVQIMDWEKLNPLSLVHATVTVSSPDASTVIYATTADNQAALEGSLTAASIPWNAEDFWVIDGTDFPTNSETTTTAKNFGSLAPGGVTTIDVGTLAAGEHLISVSVDTNHAGAISDNIVFTHFVNPVTGSIQVKAINSWHNSQFNSDWNPPTATAVVDFAVVGPVPAQGVRDCGTYPLVGVTTADFVVVMDDISVSPTGLLFTAVPSAVDTVRLFAHNITAAPIATGTKTLTFGFLEANDIAGHIFTVGVQNVTVTKGARHVTSSMMYAGAKLQEVINAHSALDGKIWSSAHGQHVVLHNSLPGEAGNAWHVGIGEYKDVGTSSSSYGSILTDSQPIGSLSLSLDFAGGEYRPFNAGNGTSQVDLTGMIERLPLGALLQDSDFLCENPLNDEASAMQTGPVGPRPIQTVMPLTQGGEEYTRFLGSPGDLVAQSDGSVSVLNYTAWTDITPTGSRVYRLYRGGGPVFVLSGNAPGSPVDWASESFPASTQPVLKGGVLACRTMLVRNFYEEANPAGGPYVVSDGDEIQMLVATYGIMGCGGAQEDGITLKGVCSPSGYGEGFAATDRYRINGKPMYRGYSQSHPNPATVQLAVHPDEREDA